jgi:hypothetical protein
MRKKAVVAYFKVLPRHLPAGIKESHEKTCHNSQCPGRDLNSGPPDYEAFWFSGDSWTHRCVIVITTWLLRDGRVCFFKDGWGVMNG